MTTKILIFKIVAVANAVVLFGGYVWYRGGGARTADPNPSEASAQVLHRSVMMKSSNIPSARPCRSA